MNAPPADRAASPDAGVGKVLEPQIEILGRRVRALQEGGADPDEEVSHSEPVELAKEAALSLSQGGVGQS
jgi:hypothetical protein